MATWAIANPKFREKILKKKKMIPYIENIDPQSDYIFAVYLSSMLWSDLQHQTL